MHPVIARLSKVWWGFELPEFRPVDATYLAFAWSDIPPIHCVFDGSLDWYRQPVSKVQGAPQPTKAKAKKLPKIAAKAAEIESKLRLTFPRDFKRFVEMADARELFAGSPTACEWVDKLDAKPFLSGWLCKIYVDQQDVVTWYLYFEGDADSCTDSVVLSSSYDPKQILKARPEKLPEMVELAEESFEAFLYRIQIEGLGYENPLSNARSGISSFWLNELTSYLSFYDAETWKTRFATDPSTKAPTAIRLRYTQIAASELESLLSTPRDWLLASHHQKLDESFIRRHANQLDWSLMCQYQNLSEALLDDHCDMLDWKKVSAYQKLSEGFLRRHWARLDIESVSAFQPLSTAFIEEFARSLHWGWLIRYQDLPVDFLKRHTKHFNKAELSFAKHLTAELLDAFADDLDWGEILKNIKLSEEQLERYADRLDWQNVSYTQDLSESFLERNLPRLVWRNICLKQKLSSDFLERHRFKLEPDAIAGNAHLSEELRAQWAERWSSLYGSVTESDIDAAPDQYNFLVLPKYFQFSDAFLERHAARLNWYVLTRDGKLSESSLRKFADKLNWRHVSQNQALSEQFMRDFAAKLDWNEISKNQRLSEAFIHDFQDRVHWWQISNFQTLSETFIREHADRVIWNCIATSQQLSPEFRAEFAKKLAE